jgi:mannitol operon transcriptional antiterminator
MVSLTTTQRDLLNLLLTTELAVSVSTISEDLGLTPRQIHYSLRELKPWLSQRNAPLRFTSGVGVQITCAADQKRHLLSELSSQSKFQLILTPGQRQQLLALHLLTTLEPLILSQLQQDVAVARATVLKDLDVVEAWLNGFSLQIERRQHRGCWVVGSELAQRQALSALVWGDVPFDRPILAVRPKQGIVFALAQDAMLLPSVGQVNALVREWDLCAAHKQITWAEAALGGRFTDQAVVQLELELALQAQRIHAQRWVSFDQATLAWMRVPAVWPVADVIGRALWPDLPEAIRTAETTALVVHLLCGARDEPWRHDLVADTAFQELIDRLLEHIADIYHVPELARDRLLREGLDAHVLSACVRQRFALWAPPKDAIDTQTERYAAERNVAQQLAVDVASYIGMTLPEDALDDLVLLLRAAIIRVRPERARRVLVVCPSGMATTQLLIARLRARFSRLGSFEVLSIRDLNAERIASADLIITTIPLTLATTPNVDVIQVHPMLHPEDIAALTQWMT